MTGGFRHGGKLGVVGVHKIESSGKITAHRAMPSRDSGNGDAKPLFYKLPYRGMVGHLGMHPASFAPGRQNIHGDTWTHAPGTQLTGNGIPLVDVLAWALCIVQVVFVIVK